jgi:hypothetical protein
MFLGEKLMEIHISVHFRIKFPVDTWFLKLHKLFQVLGTTILVYNLSYLHAVKLFRF